jgi:hypothetical protein
LVLSLVLHGFLLVVVLLVLGTRRAQPDGTIDALALVQVLRRRAEHQRRRGASLARKAARRAKEIRRRERADVKRAAHLGAMLDAAARLAASAGN